MFMIAKYGANIIGLNMAEIHDEIILIIDISCHSEDLQQELGINKTQEKGLSVRNFPKNFGSKIQIALCFSRPINLFCSLRWDSKLIL